MRGTHAVVEDLAELLEDVRVRDARCLEPGKRLGEHLGRSRS